MAPARPYWKGYLKFSLVFLPDCALPGDLLGKEGIVPAGQPPHRKPTASSARSSVTGEVVERHDKGPGI